MGFPRNVHIAVPELGWYVLERSSDLLDHLLCYKPRQVYKGGSVENAVFTMRDKYIRIASDKRISDD